MLTTTGSQATDTIANIGKLLRSVQVEGVTALSGKYSGFSVRSDELGDKPLVVAAKEGRVAIGYGLPATLSGLLSGTGKGKTLAEDPAYSDAVDSLGDTPISGFADGAAALRLADSLIPGSDKRLRGSEEVPEEHPLPRPRLRHPGRAGDGEADRRPEVGVGPIPVGVPLNFFRKQLLAVRRRRRGKSTRRSTPTGMGPI